MNCAVVLEDLHLVPQFTCFPEQSVNRNLLITYLPIFNFAVWFPQLQLMVNCWALYPYFVRDYLFRNQRISIQNMLLVFLLQLSQNKKIAGVEVRLKGDFIDDLLSENFSDSESIINRARRLNYDITLPHRVLLLDIQNFTSVIKSFSQNEGRILQFKTELVNTVQLSLERLGKGMVVNKRDNLIILVQLQEPDCPE